MSIEMVYSTLALQRSAMCINRWQVGLRVKDDSPMQMNVAMPHLKDLKVVPT